MDSLERLFGSPTRLRLLRLFLFNKDMGFQFDDIVRRTKLPPDSVRSVLNELIASKLLQKKASHPAQYRVNLRFEHLAAIDAFIRQTTSVRPTDVAIALKKAGALKLIALSGLFTGTVESQVDLLVVGDNLNDRALTNAVRALEAELGREIRYASFVTTDFRYRMGVYDRLLRDVFDYPHRLVLDKIGL